MFAPATLLAAGGTLAQEPDIDELLDRDEIGKYEPITIGVSIDAGRVDSVRVALLLDEHVKSAGHSNASASY